MDRFNYFLLDTFSNELFKGNPTPICILKKPLSAERMQLLAKEFGSPVTVFVDRSDKGKNYSIRYFTVTDEIPACGHGTLGAAYVLLKKDKSPDQVIFQTIEGIKLKASKEEGVTYIEYPKFGKSYKEIPPSVYEALGIDLPKAHFFCTELESLFIELENAEKIKAVKPDFDKLTRSTDTIKEVVVMSESDDRKYDFILRSFCPWVGIHEDPVTGSIHSVLGHYWKEQLHKDELVAYQASERGGQINIKPRETSVKIGGYCKTVIEGHLKI